MKDTCTALKEFEELLIMIKKRNNEELAFKLGQVKNKKADASVCRYKMISFFIKIFILNKTIQSFGIIIINN